MSAVSNNFTKAERLCRTKIITHIFEEGNVFHTGIFKVVWSPSPVHIPSPAQVAFSVSKRSFRHAVSRNRARRRMKEAYRLNKAKLYEHLLSGGKQIVFVVILKGTEMPGYELVEKSMALLLDKLIRLNTA